MKLMNYPPIHRGRGQQSLKKIPEQECMQLKLKNRVSGKNQITNDVNCSKEVLSVINCIQNSNLNTDTCKQHLKSLSLCYKQYYETKKQLKIANTADKLTPGETKLTASQFRKLFAMYKI